LSLNSLDVELYKHAQDIFLQQQRHLMQKNQVILKQQHVHLLSGGVSPKTFEISYTINKSTHTRGIQNMSHAY